jgi:hypothetical protein
MKIIVMKEHAYRNRILAEENAANVSMQRQLQANRDLNSALLGAALIFNPDSISSLNLWETIHDS